MTRQHFNVLAQEISRIEDEGARFSAANAVAKACAYFNPTFNWEKFFIACGVKEY